MKNLIPPFPVYERIYLMRLFAGMNQVEMAQKLGASQSWLSKVEIGQMEISAQHLFLLKVIFGVSADAILDGVIPYREIAEKMNRNGVVPSRFAQGADIQIQALYPIISALQRLHEVESFVSVLEDLKVKPFIFAAPSLLVNQELFIRILHSSAMRRIFGDKDNFKILKLEFQKIFDQSRATALSRMLSYNDAFIEKWLNISHEFNLPSEYIEDKLAHFSQSRLMIEKDFTSLFRAKEKRVGAK